MPLFTVSKDCGAASIDVPELGLYGVKPGDEFELAEQPNTDLIVPVKPGDEFELAEQPNTDLIVPVKPKAAPKAEADQPKEADK